MAGKPEPDGLDLNTLRALRRPRRDLAKLTGRIAGHLDDHDGYLAFSGGKDSLVALHLTLQVEPNIPVVFFDSGLEYPRDLHLHHRTRRHLEPEPRTPPSRPTTADRPRTIRRMGPPPAHPSHEPETARHPHRCPLPRGARSPRARRNLGRTRRRIPERDRPLVAVLQRTQQPRHTHVRRLLHQHHRATPTPRRPHRPSRRNPCLRARMGLEHRRDLDLHRPPPATGEPPSTAHSADSAPPEKHLRVSHMLDGAFLEHGRITRLRRGWPTLFEELAHVLPPDPRIRLIARGYHGTATRARERS